MHRTSRNLMHLGANAWAGSMDAMVGAGLVCVVFGPQTLWWYLPIGSILALLPDIIHLPWLYDVLRGKDITYDHHQTWSHRPIYILPGATLLALLLGGPWWALTAFACVYWHFLHDYPFGDGYLNWFWLPFGLGVPDRAADEDHDFWLERNFLSPSPRFQSEVLFGLAALGFGLWHAGFSALAPCLCLAIAILFLAWFPLTARYHRPLR